MKRPPDMDFQTYLWCEIRTCSRPKVCAPRIAIAAKQKIDSFRPLEATGVTRAEG